MTKREKRLQKIRQNPKNVTFDQLRQVLEDHGFEMRPSSGTSHHFFRAIVDNQDWVIVVPFKKPHIKPTYVRQALKAIDEIIAATSAQSENEDNDDNAS